MAKVIGITGSFGSGKTTVAKFFEGFGLRVLDADMIAHEAFRAGSQTQRKIAEVFPGVCQDGEVDRQALAEIVFKDAKKLRALEAIVHPYVFEVISKEIVGAGDQHIVVDMPLLFETGFHKECFKTLVVKASPEETAKRLGEKGFSEKDVKARQAAQMNLAEKEKQADFIIDNSKSLENTKKQIEKIWKKIKP